MGKPDIPSVSTFECRSILDSIQNEFDKLQKEDYSLSKLQQDLADLIAQRNILAKRKGFNAKYCLLCCSAFNLLFKRKLLCQDCQFLICRSCSTWDYPSEQWLCKVCEKQKLFNALSREWLCGRIRTDFGNFSAVKALQNFFRLRRISDSENDSGYGAAADLPLMKLFSSHSLNKDFKMNDPSSHNEDCEEEDDDMGDEEELAEIQYSIETILEGLLGGTLDDALVDQLYPNSSIYVHLFTTYHVKLVEVIQNLSKALQKALHNLPAENGLTPTTAHAALKNVITSLVEECQQVPPLQEPEQTGLDSTVSSAFDFSNIFSSYDSLVATAVINKVIEESQSKFKNCGYTSLEESLKLEPDNMGVSIDSEMANDSDLYSSIKSATPFDLPIESVQIEEIEEITQEFTDSEEDKLSSISKRSNSVQSMDEIGLQKHPDLDIFIDVDHLNQAFTPFPEFGCDLVDESTKFENGVICHPTTIASWEENWLFRKKKHLPLYSNLKYQLLTYCDEPPSMLIPCPSETTDDMEQDELSSELSEPHSAGSLEFSSDPCDTISENDNSNSNIEVPIEITSKSEKQASINSSPVSLVNNKLVELQTNIPCLLKELNNVDTSDLKTDYLYLKDEERILDKSCVQILHTGGDLPQPELNIKKELDLSFMRKNHVGRDENILTDNICVSTPPRPGTIAEREHKKWQNAVPIKNNPYSAENISRRYSYSKKGILKETASSFEEFERKLSTSSSTSEPALNKVNCGPKSIDTELYKRDYYVNQEHDIPHCEVSQQKSDKYSYTGKDDYFGGLSEEALNSFEEKVYISSGKVFTLENRVRRLEREIKDPPVSPDLSTEIVITSNMKQADSHMNGTPSNAITTSIDDPVAFPPIECSSPQLRPDSVQVFPVHKSQLAAMKTDPEKVKKAKPCRKVHSLTARSLSREFRDLAKQNIPKPMNRTIAVPALGSEEGASERESLYSPVSVQSSCSVGQPDNGHGYTSDESNTSTNSTPRRRRQISRSILERATYWERRAEQGLLSDASVSEEFPGIDINPE